MKKLFSLSLVFIILFSACASKTIQVKKYNDVDEKIISFMIKEDSKSLIVIGEKYHYIFEPNKTFEYLINNKQESFKLDIENGYYILDKKAFARFNVEIDEEKSSKDFIIWAYQNEAKKSKTKDGKDYLKLEIKMNGKYYLPNPEINNNIPKTDRIYQIKIKQSEIVDQNIEISPIKEVAKGVLGIVGVGVFIVIGIPYFLIGELSK